MFSSGWRLWERPEVPGGLPGGEGQQCGGPQAQWLVVKLEKDV